MVTKQIVINDLIYVVLAIGVINEAYNAIQGLVPLTYGATIVVILAGATKLIPTIDQLIEYLQTTNAIKRAQLVQLQK
jgi:hypothetical protein